MSEQEPGARRAWGWVHHLRDGGTVPWLEWTVEGEPGGLALPGAQQLELLRRLNTAGAVPPSLATRVLETSAPGRGQPDLELVGAVDARPFGPRPVDPAGLPAGELLRVSTSLLADDLVATGLPEPARRPLTRPWRSRYRLAGDPVLADPRRADLVARVRPPGGRGSAVLVLGTDLGQMLVDAWTARALGYGAPSWREFLAAAERGGGVPPKADLLRTSRAWAGRVGVDRVRVVLDLDALPRLVRVRRPLATAPVVSADAVELGRRVGQVTGLLVVPAERRALLRQTFLPRLAGLPGEPLVLPPRHVGWARERARAMRDGLLDDGYAVHGDPDGLLPVDRPGVPRPTDAGVLALSLRLLLERR